MTEESEAEYQASEYETLEAQRDSLLDDIAEKIETTKGLRIFLSQDDLWKNQQGDMIKVSDIPPAYALNILRWIERRARVCHDHDGWERFLAIARMWDGLESSTDGVTWKRMGREDMGDHAIEALDAMERELAEETWEQWLHRQPLWIALTERSKIREPVEIRRSW